MHRCPYDHADDALPPDVVADLERRAFQAVLVPFGAGASVRDEHPGPFASPRSSRLPETASLLLDKALERLTEALQAEAELVPDENMAQYIAHELVGWCSRSVRSLAQIAPQLGEERAELLQSASGQGAWPGSDALLIETVTTWRPNLQPAISACSRFLSASEAEHDGTTAVAEETSIERASLVPNTTSYVARECLRKGARRYLLDAWLAEVSADESRLIRRAIAYALPPFLQSLVGRLCGARKPREQIHDIFGRSARMWDLSDADLEVVESGILADALSFLDRHPWVRTIADLLGRRRSVGSPAPSPRTASRFVESVGRSEILGVTWGRDIGSLLATERAVFSDVGTEDIFSYRFASSRLLNYAYRSTVVCEVPIPESHHPGGFPNRCGPIVLCVDTSGSMAGIPERVARAAAIAFVRLAVEAGRSCYIVAFSSTTRAYDVVDTEVDVPSAIEFLSVAYRGGTHLPGAIRHALGRLSHKRSRDADVLVISDFRIPGIPPDVADRVDGARRRFNARFYGLTIADGLTWDPLHLFDRSWVYDPQRDVLHGDSLVPLDPA